MDPNQPTDPGSGSPEPASAAQEAEGGPNRPQAPLTAREYVQQLAATLAAGTATDVDPAVMLQDINQFLAGAGPEPAIRPAGQIPPAGTGLAGEPPDEVRRALNFGLASPQEPIDETRAAELERQLEEGGRQVLIPRLIAAEQEARMLRATANSLQAKIDDTELLRGISRGGLPGPTRSSSHPGGVQARVREFSGGVAQSGGTGVPPGPAFRTAFKEQRSKRSSRSPGRREVPVVSDAVAAQAVVISDLIEEVAKQRSDLSEERRVFRDMQQELRLQMEQTVAVAAASAGLAGPTPGGAGLGGAPAVPTPDTSGAAIDVTQAIQIAVTTAVGLVQQTGAKTTKSYEGGMGDLKIPSHLRAPTFDASKLPKLDWSNIPKDFLLRLDWINELEQELKTMLCLYYPHGEGEAYSKRVFERAKTSWLTQCKHKDYVILELNDGHSASGNQRSSAPSSGSEYGSGNTFASAEALYDIQHVEFEFLGSGLDTIKDENWRLRESFLESQIAPALVKLIPNNLRSMMKVLLGEQVIPAVPDQLAYVFFHIYRHHKMQYRSLQATCHAWQPNSHESIEVLVPKLKRYEKIMELWGVEKRTLELMTELVYPILNKKMESLPGDAGIRWRNYRSTFLRPDLHEGRDWTEMWKYLDQALGYLDKYPPSSMLRVKTALKGEVVEANGGGQGQQQGHLGNGRRGSPRKDKKRKGKGKGKGGRGGPRRKGHQAENQQQEQHSQEAHLAAPIMSPPGNYKGTIAEAWKLYEQHGGCKHCWKGQHSQNDCFVKSDGKPPLKKAEGYPRYDFWYNGGKGKKERNKGKNKERNRKKAEAKLAAAAASASAAAQAQFAGQGSPGKPKGVPKGGAAKGGATKGAGGGCFQCGDPGHFKRECPQLPKGGGKGGGKGESKGYPGKGAPQANWSEPNAYAIQTYSGQQAMPAASNQIHVPGSGFYSTVPPFATLPGKGGAVPSGQAPQQQHPAVPVHHDSQVALTQGYAAAQTQPAQAASQTVLYWHGPQSNSAITLPESRDAGVHSAEVRTAMETQRLFREAGAFVHPG